MTDRRQDSNARTPVASTGAVSLESLMGHHQAAQVRAAGWQAVATHPLVGTWMLDRDLVVTWGNEQAAELCLDGPLEAALGRPLAELVPAAVIERMETIRSMLETQRQPLIGSAFWRGVRLRSSFNPIRNEDDVLSHMLILTYRAPLSCDLPPEFEVFEAGYVHLGEFARLTRRELEVLAYIGLGYSQDEIARTLTRSTRTIKRFREEIAAKLGIRDRVRMASVARDAGLLPHHAALGRVG